MKNLPENNQLSTWRFELKYRISVFELHKMRIALRPFMVKDYFTNIAPSGGYLIRSLYYDTYDYRAYSEKMAGDHERIKFRLRTYTLDIEENSRIRVEMKVRKGNAMEKHVVHVSIDDYNYFVKKKHWPENDNPILQEFERYMHLWNLKPQVLIQYNREGYEDREKNGIRITFDQNVCAAHCNKLFPTEPVFFRNFQKNAVILEIKCKDKHSLWLRNFVRNYGLRWVANSKFTQAIQSARNDLFHPDGVVIIR